MFKQWRINRLYIQLKVENAKLREYREVCQQNSKVPQFYIDKVVETSANVAGIEEKLNILAGDK